MILLYKIFSSVLYPLLIIFFYLRKIKKKEDPIRYKEKLFASNFKVDRKFDSKLYWFHAASIGEFKSILPILKELINENKDIEFLITTTTLSSSILAKEKLSKIKNSRHRFLPIDTSFLTNKFIKLWKPNAIFFVDSEIWPNLILNAKQNKIPLALINARITFRSFKRWSRFPNVAKKIFGAFNLSMCSNTETQNFLNKLNVNNVHFKGNIKLIGEINENKFNEINENFLSKKRFWLAASTHKEEDVFCIRTHINLKRKFSDIITIIAPRHINRANEIQALCEKFNLKSQVLNKNENMSGKCEIIIINYFGDLQNYYKYAKSVFVGKSITKKLKNEGGQSPIEAAKLNCKIYHGPYVYNFNEIYEILKKLGISNKINDDIELSKYLIEDLKNPVKESNEISKIMKDLADKTLTDTMRLINNFLQNENK